MRVGVIVMFEAPEHESFYDELYDVIVVMSAKLGALIPENRPMCTVTYRPEDVETLTKIERSAKGGVV